MRDEASGSSEVTTTGRGPEPAPEDVRDAPGMLLVDGDDQAAGVRLAAAHVSEPLACLAQHRRQPLPVDGEGGPEPLVGERARQRVVEGRLVGRAIGRGPFHLAAGPREVDRPHHATVSERIAVAVLVVGDRLILLVAHEGDGLGIAPEWRPRQGQAAGGAVERRPERRSPCLVLGRMVDLVEHDVRAPDRIPDRSRAQGHLLVAGHDAVHIQGQAAIGRGPCRVEMELEPRGRMGPLDLEVGGRRHDHERGTPLGEGQPERSEGEGGLAGTGRRDGEEVGSG